jgi:pilus assembly protein CpaC
MKKAFFIISLIILSLIIVSSEDYALDEAGEELKLYLGEVKIISVSNPTRIVIGNPNVADVINVSKNEITIGPKATGTTTLVFWDIFGEQSYRVRVFAEDLNEIKRRIDNLLVRLNLPEVYTKAEEEEGKVLLLGRVKSSQDKERITIALGPLKDKALDLIEVKEEEAVVEIDVQILELNKGATNTLGLTWPGSVNLAERGSPALSGTKWSTLFKVLNLERGTVSSGTYTSDPFIFKLDALIQEGKARVLSRPRLACQSGKEAQLLVGGEKPIFTTAAQGTAATSTNVEYKEYGIKLKIRPTVNAEDRIKLALNVEVSDVGEAETIGLTGAPTAKAYPLTKRTTSTELYLENGQTLAIGGLMKQKTEEDLRKFPWLADIPVLGLFFRQRTTTTGKGASARDDTELFITLTPKIISWEKEARQVKKGIKPEIISPAVVTAHLPEPIAGYAKVIQKRILENLTYPDSAKEAGFQGIVKLSLHLSYQGELLQAILKESSGYKILDDQAISVAEDVVSYPPFPSSIEQNELWIDIPIDYRLD